MEEPLSKNYHFIFMDIVGFSRPGIYAAQQVQKISYLTTFVKESKIIKRSVWDSLVTLFTGDGMVIGFPDSIEKPYLLALELQRMLKDYNKDKKDEEKIEVRIGLHSGAVYDVTDINGRPNVCGTGIITARRIMDMGEADHILASVTATQDLMKLRPDYADKIHHMDIILTKHEEPLDIYSIYDTEIGNPRRPKRFPDEKYSFFKYLRAAMELKIIDSSSMLVDHKHTIAIKNVSDQEIDRHHSFIEGEVPRAWHDLRMKVMDKNGNELETELYSDLPLRKDYAVKFVSLLKPSEIIEYDEHWLWEEKENFLEYVFSKPVDLFEFNLIYPSSMGKLSLNVFEKKDDTKKPVAGVTTHGNNVVTWTTDKPPFRGRLRFEWG